MVAVDTGNHIWLRGCLHKAALVLLTNARANNFKKEVELFVQQRPAFQQPCKRKESKELAGPIAAGLH